MELFVNATDMNMNGMKVSTCECTSIAISISCVFQRMLVASTLKKFAGVCEPARRSALLVRCQCVDSVLQSSCSAGCKPCPFVG